MNEIKFIEIDKDKFKRLDQIDGFYKVDEIFVHDSILAPTITSDRSYGVVVFSDKTKCEISIEYYYKLKKELSNEKENT